MKGSKKCLSGYLRTLEKLWQSNQNVTQRKKEHGNR